MQTGYVSYVGNNNFKGKTLYSFRLQNEDKWFNCGGTDPKVAKGDKVEFDYTDKNGRGEVSIPSLRKLGGSNEVHQGTSSSALTAASSSGGGLSKDQYWVNKEKKDEAKAEEYAANNLRIQWQAARNSAIEITGILVTAGVLTIPAKNGGEAILGKVHDLTERYFKETGAVGEAPVEAGFGSDSDIP